MEIKHSILRLYAQAAKDLKIPFEIIHQSKLLSFAKGNAQWSIYVAVPSINDGVACAIADSKSSTSYILQKNNIPVPAYDVFKDVDVALEFFKLKKNNNQDVVVKPIKGLGGKGITLKPKTKPQFIKAFENAKKQSAYIQVEDFVEGIDYRIFVVGGKVVAVSEREPATVKGDNKNTISELIEIYNVKRKANFLPTIKIDHELRQFVKKAGFTLRSIPKKGERIVLRGNCNMATGGTTIDRTDVIHPLNKKIAIKATKALGLEVCGVDFITSDITKPYTKVGGYINELNHNPCPKVHYYPAKGKVQEVCKDVHKHAIKLLKNKK